MQKRHTLHGAAARTARPISIIPGESGTRLQRATPTVEDNIQASIDFAMSELDALEVPYRASAPPLTEPVQQMPRGMPPLPFNAPHPRNMPPLPMRPPVSARPLPAPSPEPAELPHEDAPPDAMARPSRWLLVVALGLGIACLGLAFWLQAR